MSFGKVSGPPATARQVQRLLELLQGAGHTDFRDARHPMGFTQRQAGGKFTRDEAEALIEQLEEAEHQASLSQPESAVAAEPKPTSTRLSSTEKALRAMPAERLASELQRRGWVVMEP